ncbi:MAG: hypothetical protein NC338_01250 [Firmicutes bacterium]|nr:hypothetical protein [Bacillota bacterium]MCM1401016.1 hypothetical protein [Bacteroides sp.]MCM1476935.1 hypothetical protein [Bacteroides sp.]
MSALRFRSIWRGLRSPRRAARSRGFGIHSPFAFRFVREVLTQRYAYYCYPRLEAAASLDGVNRRMVKALFRLALFFRPEAIEVRGAISPSVALALRLGNPCPETPPEADATCVVALPEAAPSLQLQWQQAESGMLFQAPELTVWVRAGHLPHQQFKISLP